MSDSKRILNDLKTAREQAASLLAALRATPLATDTAPRDLYKKVTGQSSLEKAIAAASRTLESYDRMIDEVEGVHHPAEVTIPAAGVGRMTFAALYSGRTA